MNPEIRRLERNLERLRTRYEHMLTLSYEPPRPKDAVQSEEFKAMFKQLSGMVAYLVEKIDKTSAEYQAIAQQNQEIVQQNNEVKQQVNELTQQVKAFNGLFIQGALAAQNDLPYQAHPIQAQPPEAMLTNIALMLLLYKASKTCLSHAHPQISTQHSAKMLGYLQFCMVLLTGGDGWWVGACASYFPPNATNVFCI